MSDEVEWAGAVLAGSVFWSAAITDPPLCLLLMAIMIFIHLGTWTIEVRVAS